ncbi:ATP-binding protein [bacterium 1XD21-13]|nr:ATP-binding protein [bacterium 1XD21-13]
MSSSMKILFELLDLVLVLGQGYLYQYFFGSFLEPRGRGRHAGLYGLVSYGALRKALDYVWPLEYTGIRMLGKELLSLLLLVILVLCSYRAYRSITLFLVAAFQAVRNISVYLAVILLDKPADLAFVLWDWLGGRGIFRSVSAWTRAAELTAGGIQVLRVVFILVLMGLALRRIVRDFKEKDVPAGRAELRFILLPAFTGLALCTLLRVIMITMEDEIPVLLYQKYPLLAFLLPVVLLLSLLSILQGVRSFWEMVSLGRERNSRMVLERQVEDLQGYLREQERIHSGLRSIRHDMKNTLAVISSLAGQQEPEQREELTAYLSSLGRTMERLEAPFHTGNQVADALLYRKYQEAQESMPDLELDAEQLFFPEAFSIGSYELGILLGNALDNAFTACLKLKSQEPEAKVFIRFVSFQRGSLFFLRVENSFDGSLIKNPQAEFPATDKKDRELHGIGMLNMKRVAEGYQGTVDWTAENGVFTLAMMLKLPAFSK